MRNDPVTDLLPRLAESAELSLDPLSETLGPRTREAHERKKVLHFGLAQAKVLGHSKSLIFSEVLLVSQDLLTYLNQDQIEQIVTGAVPEVRYNCRIEIWENLQKIGKSVEHKTCGTGTLSTKEPTGLYFPECDGIHLALYGSQIDVVLRKISSGPKETWMNRGPVAYSAMSMDYAIPRSFDLRLGTEAGSLLNKRFVVYHASCDRE